MKCTKNACQCDIKYTANKTKDFINLSNNNINWYRVSQQAKSKEPKVKNPYKIVRIDSGVENPIESLKNKRVRAFSAEQARFLFIKKYMFLEDLVSVGVQIRARLDTELMETEKRNLEIAEQREKDKIQNAWWNKD